MKDKYSESDKKNLENKIEKLFGESQNSPKEEKQGYAIRLSRLADEYYNLTGDYYRRRIEKR